MLNFSLTLSKIPENRYEPPKLHLNSNVLLGAFKEKSPRSLL